MEVNNKTYEIPKMEVHQGLTAGAITGGAIGTVKALAPQLKDSFSKSIDAQKSTLDKFANSGKTVDEYIGAAKQKIKAMQEAGSVQKTMNSFQNKGMLDKLRNYEGAYSELIEKGTKNAYKDLDKTQKLIESGKPSKLMAAKESVMAFTSKVADKMGGFKTSVQEGLKSTKGVKGKFKAIKDATAAFIKETPSLKKAGKLALIGTIIGVGAALIGKAVSGGEEE